MLTCGMIRHEHISILYAYLVISVAVSCRTPKSVATRRRAAMLVDVRHDAAFFTCVHVQYVNAPTLLLAFTEFEELHFWYAGTSSEYRGHVRKYQGHQVNVKSQKQKGHTGMTIYTHSWAICIQLIGILVMHNI